MCTYDDARKAIKVCIVKLMKGTILTTYDDARKAMVQTAARTPRKAASKERKQRRVTGLLR